MGGGFAELSRRFDMDARPGDELVIKGHRTGQPDRKGEVLEARGAQGGPPFVVRWDDTGHTTVLYPGTDCEVHGAAHGSEASATTGGAR
jgi:hypothetical protein